MVNQDTLQEANASERKEEMRPQFPRRSKMTLGIVVCLLGVIGISLYAANNLYLDHAEQDNRTKIAEDEKIGEESIQPHDTDLLENEAYVHTQHGFSLRPPKGWILDESGRFNTHVIFLNTVQDYSENDPFVANINVVSESNQDFNLEDYISETKNVLHKFLQDYQLVDERRETIDGRDVIFIGGTFSQGIFPLRNLQLYVIKDGKAYVVTGTALNSTWDNHKDILEASLRTFVAGI